MDGELELSILDHVRLADDGRFSTAVANSVRLARIAEDCGYARYWIAEHHGPNLACASPEVMIGAIAAATSRIRVGSAGVLLSYYSPFKVAETFQTLAALYPGRIDLGVARGSGVRETEVFAALMDGRPRLNDDPKAYSEAYEHKIRALRNHMRTARLASEAAQHGEADTGPQFWLLGSGTESAQLAARFGTGVSLFAGWTGTDLAPVVADYTRTFIARNGEPPTASIAIAGLCADTDEEAEAARKEAGFPDDHPGIWGTPDRCRRIILEMAQRHRVSRIVVLPICSKFRQRERMVRMLSEALPPRRQEGALVELSKAA
jgi:luciferase family oxidoreductase group 1